MAEKEEYVRASEAHFEMGQVMQCSVYNENGYLLLKKGKVVTAGSQKDFLLEHGYILKSDFRFLEPVKKKKFRREEKTSKTNIFEIKNKWLGELYFLLLGDQRSKLLDFTPRILNLSVDIQLQAKLQHDALIASLQLDFENHYGLVHALHCATSSEMIGKSLGIGQIERLVSIAAALTHDIGIIKGQERLNFQKADMTSKEWAGIKKHPTEGVKILRKLGVDDQRWLSAVEHHHERLDGSGYLGLKAKKISMQARILAVADTYSAMVHHTVFRKENSGKKALQTLYEGRNVLFDSDIVTRFIGEIGVFPPGSLVQLESEEIAVVTAMRKPTHQPDVVALISAEGEQYEKPIPRQTRDKGYRIIGDEQLGEHRALFEEIEQLWS
ncbi:MAG: HD domain-containing protein [Halieaceae bacterium]|jgi:putative nucleotidyltransferase with HDIG domain|nr:HD domain-containing protein [Halieaceae bacterium]